jgi:ABC-2 type transport system ATP-binding protein
MMIISCRRDVLAKLWPCEEEYGMSSIAVMAAIKAQGLTRVYRVRTGRILSRPAEITAVSDVSFEVSPGELFGLLGPDGAGKTTTIKMLNTLLIPTRGTAYVMGHDVARDPVAVRRLIGYVFGGNHGIGELVLCA